LQRRYDYILPSGVLYSNILESQVFRTDLLSPLPPGLEINDSATAADHLPVLMIFNSPYVERALYVTAQPTSQTINEGSSATFSVGVGGEAPFAYEWYKDGTNRLLNQGNISGANSSNLVISSVGAGDVGTYSVVISNARSNLMSAAASLAVILPPQVSLSPGALNVSAGASLSLTANVHQGTPPFAFQWFYAGMPIPGATSQTLVRPNMQLSDAGAYGVSAGNSAGTSQSGYAIVRVTAETLRWDFNSFVSDTNTATGSLEPSNASGTAGLIGGDAELIGATTSSFAAGSSTDPAHSGGDNSGWNTSGYPPQGTGDKTAGVQFRFSTAGLENIVLSWQQRVSATASRYYQFQYSTNGSDFVDLGPAIVMTADSVYQGRTVALTGLHGADNNPNFAVRIVSQWESTAIGSANNNFVGTSSTYTPGGTLRFDMVTVTGQPIIAASAVTFLEMEAGRLRFGVSEPVAFPVLIQGSTNLVDWVNIQTLFPPASFVRTNQLGQEFFRTLRNQ
ncbi:MAG: immunoglobulin domain-containing protein, partial [Limisphaerales bacterium]